MAVVHPGTCMDRDEVIVKGIGTTSIEYYGNNESKVLVWVWYGTIRVREVRSLGQSRFEL